MVAAKECAAAAVAALETNDAAALASALRGAAASAVNEKVVGGKLADTAIGSSLAYEDGDTLLHLAMRNKRWHIRRALVADPRTDPMIANSQGRTPPGMQLRDSFPRVLVALSCALIGVIKQASRVALVMIGLLCLAAGVDMLLAARWWWTAWSSAYVAKHPRTIAQKKQEEKRAAKSEARKDGRKRK